MFVDSLGMSTFEDNTPPSTNVDECISGGEVWADLRASVGPVFGDGLDEVHVVVGTVRRSDKN